MATTYYQPVALSVTANGQGLSRFYKGEPLMRHHLRAVLGAINHGLAKLARE